MNNDIQHQANGIGDDMPLAPFDLFPSIIAGNPAAFRGLDTLAINDTGGGCDFASFLVPSAHHQ